MFHICCYFQFVHTRGLGRGGGGGGGTNKSCVFQSFSFLDAGTKLKVFSAPDKVGF